MSKSRTKAASKPKRDPNIPVLAFTIGETKTEIFIAGPGEYIDYPGSKSRQWGPNSLVTRVHTGWGVNDTEVDLHDAGTWGWLGRLIAEHHEVELHTLTDIQMRNAKLEAAGA